MSEFGQLGAACRPPSSLILVWKPEKTKAGSSKSLGCARRTRLRRRRLVTVAISSGLGDWEFEEHSIVTKKHQRRQPAVTTQGRGLAAGEFPLLRRLASPQASWGDLEIHRHAAWAGLHILASLGRNHASDRRAAEAPPLRVHPCLTCPHNATLQSSTLGACFLTLARCGFLVAYSSGFHERFHEFRASFSFTNM